MRNLKLYGIAMLLALGVSFGATQFHTFQPYPFVGIETAYADSAPAASASPAAGVPVQVASPAPAAAKLPLPPSEKITWVQSIVDFLQSTPWGGKILAILFSVLAIVAVVATALASILMAVSAAFDAMGKKLPWAATVSDWIDAVNHWVKYVSMYNAKKPDPAEEKKTA